MRRWLERVGSQVLMRCLFLCLWGLWAVAFATSSTQAASCIEQKSRALNRLERVHVYKGIRVFWTELPPRSGADHRLPKQSAVDLNHSGIPDLIENIAIQADAARRAYIAAGFPDPLDAPRYQGVEFIDINILKMKYNGLAYDAALVYPDAPERGLACTLRIDISNQLETGLRGPVDKRVQPVFTKHWFVVGHEMFHLFQYGLTQFKRSWINEPTAKWAEYALRRGGLYENKLPHYSLPSSSRELKSDLIEAPTRNTANLFWSALIKSCRNPFASHILPKSMLEETYTDGQLIFKDGLWDGVGFILAVYQALQDEDIMLSSVHSLNPSDWPERYQISPEHDERLVKVIKDVVRNCGVNSDEVNLFLDVK
ncbi:hypothetical protein AAIB41_13235 [Brucella sp. BE17]|uniref:hypothetical protein n=1 Tax=Brucella sp. BE17 TaxID=3142977 RepID=UPI0031BB12A4